MFRVATGLLNVSGGVGLLAVTERSATMHVWYSNDVCLLLIFELCLTSIPNGHVHIRYRAMIVQQQCTYTNRQWQCARMACERGSGQSGGSDLGGPSY